MFISLLKKQSIKEKKGFKERISRRIQDFIFHIVIKINQRKKSNKIIFFMRSEDDIGLGRVKACLLHRSMSEEEPEDYKKDISDLHQLFKNLHPRGFNYDNHKAIQDINKLFSKLRRVKGIEEKIQSEEQEFWNILKPNLQEFKRDIKNLTLSTEDERVFFRDFIGRLKFYAQCILPYTSKGDVLQKQHRQIAIQTLQNVASLQKKIELCINKWKGDNNKMINQHQEAWIKENNHISFLRHVYQIFKFNGSIEFWKYLKNEGKFDVQSFIQKFEEIVSTRLRRIEKFIQLSQKSLKHCNKNLTQTMFLSGLDLKHFHVGFDFKLNDLSHNLQQLMEDLIEKQFTEIKSKENDDQKYILACQKFYLELQQMHIIVKSQSQDHLIKMIQKYLQNKIHGHQNRFLIIDAEFMSLHGDNIKATVKYFEQSFYISRILSRFIPKAMQVQVFSGFHEHIAGIGLSIYSQLEQKLWQYKKAVQQLRNQEIRRSIKQDKYTFRMIQLFANRSETVQTSQVQELKNKSIQIQQEYEQLDLLIHKFQELIRKALVNPLSQDVLPYLSTIYEKQSIRMIYQIELKIRTQMEKEFKENALEDSENLRKRYMMIVPWLPQKILRSVNVIAELDKIDVQKKEYEKKQIARIHSPKGLEKFIIKYSESKRLEKYFKDIEKIFFPQPNQLSQIDLLKKYVQYMTPEIRIRIKEKEQVRDLFVQIEERIIGELEKFINDFSEHFKEESTSRRGFHLYKIYKNLAQFGQRCISGDQATRIQSNIIKSMKRSGDGEGFDLFLGFINSSRSEPEEIFKLVLSKWIQIGDMDITRQHIESLEKNITINRTFLGNTCKQQIQSIMNKLDSDIFILEIYEKTQRQLQREIIRPIDRQKTIEQMFNFIKNIMNNCYINSNLIKLCQEWIKFTNWIKLLAQVILQKKYRLFDLGSEVTEEYIQKYTPVTLCAIIIECIQHIKNKYHSGETIFQETYYTLLQTVQDLPQKCKKDSLFESSIKNMINAQVYEKPQLEYTPRRRIFLDNYQFYAH